MFFTDKTLATQAEVKPSAIVPPHVRARAIARASSNAIASPGAAPIAAPGASPGAPIDHHQAAHELVTLATVSFFPAYPALRDIYDANAIDNIARALAPVLRKYNYDPNVLPVEAVLLLSVAPLIQPTIAAVKAGRAAQPKASTHANTAQTQSQTGGAAVIVQDVSQPIIATEAPAITPDYSNKSFLERFPTFNGGTGAPGT